MNNGDDMAAPFGVCPFGRGVAAKRESEPHAQLQSSASQNESLDESESGSETGAGHNGAERPSITYTTYLKVCTTALPCGVL